MTRPRKPTHAPRSATRTVSVTHFPAACATGTVKAGLNRLKVCHHPHNSHSTETDGPLAMKFYDQIADVYDLWIPWKERIRREIPFYEQFLQELRASTIVDVGCGTGRLTVELACRGYQVTSLDSSSRMLEITAQHADARDCEIGTVKGDITKTSVGLPTNVDALLCVGGTLAHFFDKRALEGFLTQARSVLRPGGGLILSLPNFERITDRKPRYLPVQANATEDGRDILFLTAYEYSKNRLGLDLLVLQREAKEWSQSVYHTAQYPWTHESVQEAIAAAGFEEPLTYGDFDYHEFDPAKHDEFVIFAEAPEKQT